MNNFDKLRYKILQEVIFEIKQLSISLKEDVDGYKDPVNLCKAEGIDICVDILNRYQDKCDG